MTKVRRNILILSAGRRVGLLRGFQAAASMSEADEPVRVVTADYSPNFSSACQTCDYSYELPLVGDHDYVRSLAKLCEEQSIGLVIPTLDTELETLSAIKEEFVLQGTTILVSDTTFVRMCNDKRLTAEFFMDRKLNTPQLYKNEDIQFPVLVKPYDGSLSKGIHVVRSDNELLSQLLSNPKNIYCEYVDHELHTEYTCDLYYDKTNKLKCVVPRERIEVRGGEVSKGATRFNNIVDVIEESLGEIKGVVGCVTVQLFRNNETGNLYFIEINARFGGGYPLTREAGADFQKWLLAEYLDGVAIQFCRNWKRDMLMLRFDDAVYLDGC